jgi:hypothetical protein
MNKAAIISRGMKVASSHPKAKAPNVAKDFPKGMELFAESMAVYFVKYVTERVEEEYKIPLLGITLSKGELLRSVEQKESVVTITNGRIQDVKYREIWRYFEYGRMDKGVIPDPILKKIFLEFRPVYKEALKKHIKSKSSKR